MENTVYKHQEMSKQQQQFMVLYQTAFPAFAKFVNRMGGNLDEAKDAFQDAILVWYEKTGIAKAGINKSEKAYVLGIAKYLWIKRFNKSLLQVPISQTDFNNAAEEEANPSEKRLLQLLKTAGEKCMKLLKSFYYDKLNPVDLALKYGFSGEHSATAQKYKCLEKVRNQVKQKSLSYADFID